MHRFSLILICSLDRFSGLFHAFMKNSPRNFIQHNAYAMRRARLALKTSVAAKTSDERIQARRWAFAWAAIASVQPLWQHPIPLQWL
jgi:hypothetical protein